MSNKFQQFSNWLWRQKRASGERLTNGTLHNIERFIQKIDNNQIFKKYLTGSIFELDYESFQDFLNKILNDDQYKQMTINENKYYYRDALVKYSQFLKHEKQKTNNAQCDIKWFKNRAKQSINYDEKYRPLYEKFQSRFGIDKLLKMTDDECLNLIFLNGNSNTMCHVLEYDKDYDVFGKIWGGSAFKYPLHKKRNTNIWLTGTSQNQKQISDREALILIKKIIKDLDLILKTIDNLSPFDSFNKFDVLYNKIKNECQVIEPDKIWYLKYLHLIHPELPFNHFNEYWQSRVLEFVGIAPLDTKFERFAQINDFIRQCGISPITFYRIFDEVFNSFEHLPQHKEKTLPTEIIDVKTEISSIDENDEEYKEKVNEILDRNKDNIQNIANDPGQNALTQDLLSLQALAKQKDAHVRKRDFVLAQMVRDAANSEDEITHEKSFLDQTNNNYVEVHHIIEFGREKGPDISLNMICLSPAHHSLIHHGNIDEVRKLYKTARETNAIKFDRFEQMVTVYQCLTKNHVDILLNKGLINNDEASKLESLIIKYGSSNTPK